MPRHAGFEDLDLGKADLVGPEREPFPVGVQVEGTKPLQVPEIKPARKIGLLGPVIKERVGRPVPFAVHCSHTGDHGRGIVGHEIGGAE